VQDDRDTRQKQKLRWKTVVASVDQYFSGEHQSLPEPTPRPIAHRGLGQFRQTRRA
jgi:hypothetical protein